MLLTSIKKEDHLTELPFYHLLKTDDPDRLTYLIKEAEQIIGFISIEIGENETYKLVKFVMNKPENSEQLIEIFYHLLEAVEKKQAQHLLIETNKLPLIELLSWLGFKKWPEKEDIYSYSFN